MNNDPNTTHFGYEQVATGDKQRRVREVFDSVAGNYDLMNDLMSLGAHRVWKAFALARTGLRPGDVALDLAAGTGDLTAGLARQVGPEGHVLHTDINAKMLSEGSDRLLDSGLGANVTSLQVNAEKLPFAASKMNCVTIGFGLRNVTDKQAVLNEMARVVKPGGRVLVLEFSKPVLKWLEPVYDTYSFKVLPALGKLIANDAESYRYLAESIRMHPGQAELRNMMQSAGLEDCTYHNLSGGIVALHIGFRY
ncbi:MAG: bifunctional demethylmenaquinone methyltransferase/2-methoxy-6-polyprenyl-1,4-benzoquinol methylase UbiE [Gammaproteobacteria bacterium]|jgi:demethylmenaquinone methyltransferase/2-methoxy-6-polyprenyl-1,4-benzoquinol methylase|nr:bifunctional demethylmenaquinone methyltransferase/2-methoxy-6-polyprenyl-1,4-benzoquinol methylase UbiE [Chromatiales bacterium]MDP6435693.1 bifunctional demethylmenaquinone methyltransferase/2-methoxy-6-polyprenyl-1,4-benzoquinol methylase UbiE [Gammaproteobacteria bacterium]MDP7041473.1 bifunctional demethylmenaquinone methyltransferase/2-methoxy-6-polyprenyl-1,4-benzoquinol methylase UbiE [Gammaproteobacteria bacterium]